MRKIKFRGKRVDNGKWVYGYVLIIFTVDDPFSEEIHVKISQKIGIQAKEGNYAVIPETVGQYTGLVDKNGVGIYEGDILFNYCEEMICNYNVVEFIDGCNLLITNKTIDNDIVTKEGVFLHSINSDCEVIGSIHDNPDHSKQ